jgi:polyhydroxyalkanoate synthesis repressor PhaR
VHDRGVPAPEKRVDLVASARIESDASPKNGMDVASKGKSSDGPITIKKYANRRLYNTATSSYVTLDHLSQMVKDGHDFVVVDAKTGEEITRSVLTQIIFEEEGKGQHLLPIQFLRQLIRFYGDSLQSLVPGYLEMSMEAFTKNREQTRERLSRAFGGQLGFKDFEDAVRNNIAMFERAVQMFTPPFSAEPDRSETKQSSNEPGDEQAKGEVEGQENEIAALRDQIDAMQRQLERLANKK